jgi:hypothetical protein
MRGSRSSRIIVGALVLLGVVRAADAAGPLLVNSAGTPYRWASPVPYNPDRGGLGVRTNAQTTADLASNFADWEAVPTANVTFRNAGALPVDVDATCPSPTCWSNFLSVCGDGLSPIIFDVDGSITDDVMGVGANNSVLGFAGPECASSSSATITEGSAVLNGRWLDGVSTSGNREMSLASFNGVFIHEFGHYLDLDHSQVNLLEGFDGASANDAAIATMFPFLVSAQQSTLHVDDQVAVSMLYPEPSFASATGTLTGTVSRNDGTAFQGAYVIARKVGDLRLTAVGVASGARYRGTTATASLRGLFEIPGLPPGDYTVEIEQISSSFTGGSSVGPVDPPAMLPGPAEFWNGANESGTSADDPTLASVIAVGAATQIGNVHFVINATAPVATATRTATPIRTPTPVRTVTPVIPVATATAVPTATTTPGGGVVSTCGSAPVSGCRQPTAPLKSTLLVKDRDPDARDALAWKWTRGAATAKADFGDPLTVTSYVLCVYDATASGPALAVAADVPAGGLCAGRACWHENARGFRYKDRDATPSGITSLTLKEGADGAAQIGLKGGGLGLAMPVLPFVQAPRVTVQLKNDRGGCWEASFGAPATKTSGVEFRDKSD